MKEFIQYVANALVNDPQNIKILEKDTQNEIKIELHIPSKEIGKVIGKHGIMADSLRTICHFYSKKHYNKPTIFKMIEDHSQN